MGRELQHVPVPADYDGDRKIDIAVFRPATGTWFVVNSSTNTYWSFAWGASTDIPVPADYDGDRRIDIAVFRPATGTWWVVNSSTNTGWSFQWGANTDIPVQGP